MLCLGLDVGTQGSKGLLLCAATNRVLARASRSYDLLPGLPPGTAEQDPETWWQAVGAIVVELLDGVDPQQIAAIGVSGQQHGFVALDAARQVIRPAKLWCDTSTQTQALEIEQATGRPLPVGFTASKIRWLRQHEPQHFARLRHVLLPHDWINFKLTGVLSMECGDASGTGFFDPVRRRFDPLLTAAVDPGLDAMLPPLLQAGAVLGTVARNDLGLAQGTIVASGGGDNMMSAIGSGATRPGVVVMSLGTSGTVFTQAAAPILDPEGLIAPFCDSTGGWLPLLCVMNCTNVTEEIRAAFDLDHARLTDLASSTPPGANGLMLHPFLQGERVPDLPHASGTLRGLRQGTLRPGLLYRAAIEGVSLNLAAGVARMERVGIEIASLRVVGGGSHNPLWCQILADILQMPLQRLAEPESAALGAAIQALWTWRCHNGQACSADECQLPLVALVGAPVEPDQSLAGLYRRQLDEFIALSRS